MAKYGSFGAKPHSTGRRGRKLGPVAWRKTAFSAQNRTRQDAEAASWVLSRGEKRHFRHNNGIFGAKLHSTGRWNTKLNPVGE